MEHVNPAIDIIDEVAVTVAAAMEEQTSRLDERNNTLVTLLDVTSYERPLMP